MTANDIRRRFLEFFAARDHRSVRSSSLVPANDPTLLFTNAGMNQFKDVFLGREKRDYSRACSSQKCVRAGGKHNDLEQVGRTRRHHTFFEMLGNFSFGDYFKTEAIPWAWELVTKEFAIPKEKLYVTVFREDDEAEELWAKIVPRERIFRRDEKDNFWQMGETGPCGPCSEIHYDMGPEASDLVHTDCKFPCPEDCGRYVEIWNLVFMQFNRDEQGQMTPLPRPSIDTGAGLERLAAVLEGKISNFDTDLFQPLIEEAAELASIEYGENHETDVSLRIIADHARAATFLISDGVLPSNEGRNYVLRKIMRRAILHGRDLGIEEPFLYKMAGHVAQMVKGPYPELAENEFRISKCVRAEEERFVRTLEGGLDRLEDDVALTVLRAISPGPGTTLTRNRAARRSERPQIQSLALKEKEQGRPIVYPGESAFKHYDTYGLPIDFIQDVLRNSNVELDQEGFDRAMAEQRERARASWKVEKMEVPAAAYSKMAEKQPTKFLGYEKVKADARVYDIVEMKKGIPPNQGPPVYEVILDQTPFYPEAGGQVGDTGWLRLDDQVIAFVENTYKPAPGVIAHRVNWAPNFDFEQRRLIDSVVEAVVDAERRDAIRRNHTATHLLHAALRNTLGTHVKQAGSLVAPDRLRFDFSHYAGVGEQDLLDIEDLVNEHILKNEEVLTQVMGLDQAVESGAMALFGEKYGDRVRVVSIADGSFSKELCGGTHVRRTGDIGLFKVVAESSVSAGTRRIEALTGTGVLEYLRKSRQTIGALSETLRSKPDELLDAAEKLTESEKKLRKELESEQAKNTLAHADRFISEAGKVKGVLIIAQRVPEPVSREILRQLADRCRARLKSGVVALGNVADGKAALIVGVTKDLTAKLDAGKIVREAAALMEGTGGGRKDLAEAGGKNPAKLDESLQAIHTIVDKML